MFSPKHQGLELQVQNTDGGLADGFHHWLGPAKGDVDGTKVCIGHGLEVKPELGAVGLQARAHIAHCSRSEAGAGSEGGGAVIGHTEQTHPAALRSPGCAHVDRALLVKQRMAREGHTESSLSMKAGMASKAPDCQRGLQIWQPAATDAARSGKGLL